MTDTQGTQTTPRIDYRKEGIEMGVIVPTFSEFYEARHKGETVPTGIDGLDMIPVFLKDLTDYLDTYGPGATR